MKAIRIRRRWSIAALMIAVALAALVFKVGRIVVGLRSVTPMPVPVVSWNIEMYRPGTIASTDLTIQTGPDRYSVLAIARYDRDGSACVEDGRGRPVTTKVRRALPPVDLIVRRAVPWLDVADVILAADPATLAEVYCLLLDPTTREFFHPPGLGVFYLPGNPPRIRLLSLGKPLPDTVGIWLDATRPPRRDTPVVRLEAKPGATVCVGPATFTVSEIKRWELDGLRFNWRRDKVRSGLGDSDAISVLLKTWSGSEHDRYNADGPFDGVKLPRSPGRPFAPGSVVRIEVGGREIETRMPEFDPVSVALHLSPGRRADPPIASQPARQSGALTDCDTTFSATLYTKNLSYQSWDLTFFGRDGRPLDAEDGPGPLIPHDVSGRSMRHQAAWYNFPLDRVGAVEVSPR